MRYALFFIGAAALVAQPYNGSQVGGAPMYQTGAYGQAMQGSGTARYFTIPTGATNFAGDFAVQFKYIETTREGYQAIFQFSGAYCWIFGYTGDAYCNIGGTNLTTSGADASNGSWHTVELRRVGSTGTVWIDGVQRASATVPTSNLGTGTNNIGFDVAQGYTLRTTSSIDEFAIWTTGSTTICAPCSGSEGGLRAYYRLNGDLNDGVSGAALTAGALSAVVGLSFAGATGGTGPYEVQLQSATFTGTCGSFTNDGLMLTGQPASTVNLFSRSGATQRCWRVLVTDAAFATTTSNTVIAPTTGSGMRSY